MKTHLLSMTLGATLLLSQPLFAQIQDKEPPAGPAPHDRHFDPLERLDKKLDLTDEQKEKIKPILAEAKPKMEAIREETKTKMKEVVTETHDKIKPLLTPEQKTKLEEMEAKMESFDREGPMHRKMHERKHFRKHSEELKKDKTEETE